VFASAKNNINSSGGSRGHVSRPLQPQLVQPLQASGFRYRPTRSPFKHKRVMMQQVGGCSDVLQHITSSYITTRHSGTWPVTQLGNFRWGTR
jgi:hypothetical protein